MRKSTLFISAILTTFMLVILAGVVAAYKNMPVLTTNTSQQEVAATATELPTAAPSLTPQEAAALAAQVMGRTDLYSVETTLFNNADAYLVTFSSGDLVYMTLGGQILSVAKLTPAVASLPPAPAKKDKPRNRPPVNSGGGGEGGGEDHDD